MDHSVEMLTNYRIIEVTDSGVIAIDRGQHVLDLDGDRVVLAIGLVPDKALYEQLKGAAREVYVAGDCVEPRRVGEATREGYVIGSTV
jgi:thioredoxin reductase